MTRGGLLLWKVPPKRPNPFRKPALILSGFAASAFNFGPRLHCQRLSRRKHVGLWDATVTAMILR